MASETCYKHYNFGDKGFLSINDMCDEDCINASLKCQPLFLHGKFVAPSSHNLSNGYGEKGHDSDHFNTELKLGMQDIDVSRVTCQGTQENGNADDSSILAIRKARTNLIAVVEVSKEVISKVDDQTKESKKHESLCLPESGMIDLTSANSMFMQSRSLNAEPLYTHRQLPKFLQESLEQSLSRLTITIRDDKLVEEKSIVFMDYTSEEQLLDLTALITKDLSEPYSIYTYRYFLHNWPHLSFLAYCDDLCVGSIVCKLDQHRKDIWRGYIAMLAVHKDFRRFKIGTKLVQKAIRRMIEQGCDEIVLETEVTNKAALNLYENLGFIRDKRLLRYYLNGVDAWRLKLWLV